MILRPRRAQSLFASFRAEREPLLAAEPLPGALKRYWVILVVFVVGALGNRLASDGPSLPASVSCGTVSESALHRIAPAKPPPYAVYVVSSDRPQGEAYVLNVLNKLRREDPLATKAKITLFNVGAPGKAWFGGLPPNVDVVQGSHDPVGVNLDPALDKHRDTPEHILWRANSARDMRDVLRLGMYSGSPFVVVLEDDVDVAPEFLRRLDAMVRSTAQERWLLWVLFHTEAFSARRFHHGEQFPYSGCTQGLMYRAAQMRGLVAYMDQHWREDPSDFLVSFYLGLNTHHYVRVAVPSVVQHLGVRSTLIGEKRRFCFSESFNNSFG